MHGGDGAARGSGLTILGGFTAAGLLEELFLGTFVLPEQPFVLLVKFTFLAFLLL